MVGADQFPSCLDWADEHEAWLRFIEQAGALDHYRARRGGPKQRRDEAFAEIAVAYFFSATCGMSVFGWEPRGAIGKRGEFLVGSDPRQPVFVEVKSPGWEDEIVKAEGQDTPRLHQPKYVEGDGRAGAAGAQHGLRYRETRLDRGAHPAPTRHLTTSPRPRGSFLRLRGLSQRGRLAVARAALRSGRLFRVLGSSVAHPPLP